MCCKIKYLKDIQCNGTSMRAEMAKTSCCQLLFLSRDTEILCGYEAIVPTILVPMLSKKNRLCAVIFHRVHYLFLLYERRAGKSSAISITLFPHKNNNT